MRRFPYFFLLAIGLALPPGCQAAQTPRHSVPFVYYLQGLDAALLESINPAIAVVDPYDSGLSTQDIRHLQQGYGQQLIAYLSVGEVDPSRKNGGDGYAYQAAWDSALWLQEIPKAVKVNENWATRRVAYWHEDWQVILLARIRILVALGYDGVMFDTVDTFYALAPHFPDRDARQDMANLVGRLRDATKQQNPAFKIFINGGMELYDTHYSTTGEPLLDLIDGQLKEDSWYNEAGPITADWTEEDLAFLRRAMDVGKPVFSIDYFTNEDVPEANEKQMQAYFDAARAFGVTPYAADRSLGTFLTFNRTYFTEAPF